MSTFTKTLPLDCVLSIVQHLDSHGIICFLKAFPCYKAYTVLVTDHTHLPKFFGIDGIERRYLNLDEKSPIDSTLKLFGSESSSKHPIRLVEISSSANSLNSLAKTYDTQDHLLPTQPIHFTNTTFVFIDGDANVLGTETEALGRRLDEFTSCNWHVGLPVLFPKESMAAQQAFGTKYESVTSFSPGLCLRNVLPESLNVSKLRSLRLENVPVVDGLHAPLLSDLAFIYATKSIRRPIIARIFAPRLQRLVVHYSNEMPHFKEMGDVATTDLCLDLASFRDYRDWGSVTPQSYNDQYYSGRLLARRTLAPLEKRVLEIARIGELNMRPSQCPSESHGGIERSDYDTDLDISFIARFEHINLYGTPFFLVTKPLMTNVYRFRWVITRPLPAEIVDVWWYFPELVSLSMTVLAKDVALPFFKAGHLHELWINLLDARPDICRSLQNADRGDFGNHRYFVDRFCIYNSPKLIRRYPHQIFELNHLHWHWAIEMFISGRIMEEISLIGFSMPFFEVDNDEKNPSGRVPWWVSNCSHLTIRPVIKYNEDSLKAGDTDVKISTAVLHSNRTVPWSNFVLDFYEWKGRKLPESIEFTLSPFFVSQKSGRVGPPEGQKQDAYLDNFYSLDWVNGIHRAVLNISGDLGAVWVHSGDKRLPQVDSPENSLIRKMGNSSKLFGQKWTLRAPVKVYHSALERYVLGPEEVSEAIPTTYRTYDICK